MNVVCNIISGKAASTLPFREYEESSSEVRAIPTICKLASFYTSRGIFIPQVEDFMKPYSDEPEDSPTFMGAYRDQEDED